MSNIIRHTQHPGQGFFSCCSVIVDKIVEYINKNKCLPHSIDNTNMFTRYNPNLGNDITSIYFKIPSDMPILEFNGQITHNVDAQFVGFNLIDYNKINPITDIYFSPSDTILNYIEMLTNKYNIDYNNTCVLFYRGNIKSTECKLPSYEEHMFQADKIMTNNPDIKFLVQSDETEYLNTMLEAYTNSFKFDEIVHMYRHNNCVTNYCTNEVNHIYSQYFLAIIYIMSKCKYVICNSGNISSWICYFRKNTNNVFQYIEDKFVEL